MTTKTVEAYQSLINNLVTQQVISLKRGDAFVDDGITEDELWSSPNVVGLLKEREIPDYYINVLLVKAISSVAEEYINESYSEANTRFFGMKRRHTDLMRDLKIIDTLLPEMKDAKTIADMDEILTRALQSMKESLVKGVLHDRCKSHGNYANICRAIAKVTEWEFPREFTERLGLDALTSRSSSTSPCDLRPF